MEAHRTADDFDLLIYYKKEYPEIVQLIDYIYYDIFIDLDKPDESDYLKYFKFLDQLVQDRNTKYFESLNEFLSINLSKEITDRQSRIASRFKKD